MTVAAEADVLRADDRRFEAMRKDDWAALDAALADDLTYVHSSARLESKKEHLAPASATMRPIVGGGSAGEINAAAAPARKQPRKSTRYSIDVLPQMATTSRGSTPRRCNPAATRSMAASSAA